MVKRANKNRFLFKVFVVRHLIGIVTVGYLAYSAFRLDMPGLALGSALVTALYIGVIAFMGLRLQKDIRRQEGSGA